MAATCSVVEISVFSEFFMTDGHIHVIEMSFLCICERSEGMLSHFLCGTLKLPKVNLA